MEFPALELIKKSNPGLVMCICHKGEELPQNVAYLCHLEGAFQFKIGIFAYCMDLELDLDLDFRSLGKWELDLIFRSNFPRRT